METKSRSMILLILAISLTALPAHVHAGDDTQEENRTDGENATETGSDNKTNQESTCLYKHFNEMFTSIEETCINITEQQSETSKKVANFEKEYTNVEIKKIKAEIQVILETIKENYFTWNDDQAESSINVDQHQTENQNQSENKIKNKIITDVDVRNKIRSLGNNIVQACTEIRNDDACPENVTVDESILFSIGNKKEDDVEYAFDYACNPKKILVQPQSSAAGV